jgi:predicted peptidase
MTLCICLLTLGAGDDLGGSEPVPGTQQACELKIPGPPDARAGQTSIRYLLFVPEDYADQASWPLMVFLHGAGERGDDLELVKKWGPPKMVEEEKDFPFVLVSPQCPRKVLWDVDLVAKLTEHVAGELKIDKQRMYITGLSLGGHATWTMVAEHPKLFAAAVPICGGGDPTQAEQIKTPIWAFHGDKDSVVPLWRSEEMVEAVNKAGGKAKLTVYPGVAHNSWTETYANRAVYQWLLSQQR